MENTQIGFFSNNEDWAALLGRKRNGSPGNKIYLCRPRALHVVEFGQKSPQAQTYFPLILLFSLFFKKFFKKLVFLLKNFGYYSEN